MNEELKAKLRACSFDGEGFMVDRDVAIERAYVLGLTDGAERKPLTDEEIRAILDLKPGELWDWNVKRVIGWIRAIERAHGIGVTG